MITDPEHLAYKRLILPIVATCTDGHYEPIGSAFVILTAGKDAIALSAAHNFHYLAREVDGGHDRCDPTTPPEFRPRVQDIKFRSAEARVIYPDMQGGMHLPYISRAYVDMPSDIAICILKIPNNFPVDLVFDHRLAINSAPPAVGTPVAAIGYAGMKALSNRMEGAERRVTHTENLTRRIGLITDVFLERGPLNHAPCFQCNIPFDSGMSGGPIIDLSHDEQISAIGIISSDSSHDPLSPAIGSGLRAIASTLWPALTTKMQSETLNGMESPTLLDFVKLGLLLDRSEPEKHLTFTPIDPPGDAMVTWR